MPQQPSTKTNGDTIESFLLILKEGIEAWQTAGALLCQMRKDNPGVYAEIIRREPMMTVDMLETIERIGRKELHPRLLLNAQLPVKRLIGFKYEDQGRLCVEPIDVVVSVVKGKPVVQKKLIRDCSRRELTAALDTSRVRTVAEQVEARNQHNNKGNAEWKALSAAPKMTRANFVAACVNATSDAPPAKSSGSDMGNPITQGLVCLGRWVIRQGFGNNCVFERTTAPSDACRRIILDDGIAVIEVCRRK